MGTVTLPEGRGDAAMADAALSGLAEVLGTGTAELQGLADCPDEDLARLTTWVTELLAAEDAAVEHGLHAALRAVPLPLRGRARALLLGDDA
jgi:hypothetical protein